MQHNPIHEALRLWQELTSPGVIPKGLRLSQWEVQETYKELQEALNLDPSELTASLLLSHFTHEFLRNQSLSMLDLLLAPEDLQAKLDKPRQLLALVNELGTTAKRDAFLADLLAAVSQYGAGERDAIKELMKNHDDVGILRRDALRSMETLSVHQFLAGLPEPEHVKPVYNQMIHQWVNINAMLKAATHMPSGVSLNLIRDPNDFNSFFCFTVRNGGNLFVVTDREAADHPLQSGMRRRPDRVMDRRMRKNWFPYDLLDLRYDEEEQRFYVGKSSSTELVASQQAAWPIKPIQEMEADELLWVTMMFDLLVERFWHQGFQAPALSYTAEMFKIEHALQAPAAAGNLQVQGYKPLSLPALTRCDILAEAVTEAEVGEKAHEPNKWLEERYGPQVPESVMNLVGPQTQVLLLNTETNAIEPAPDSYRKLDTWGREKAREGRLELSSMVPTDFGSKEKLDADRKFIARANFASHVDLLAKAEFEARHQEVERWYEEQVLKNQPNLLPLVGHVALGVPAPAQETFDHWETGAGAIWATRTEEGGRGPGLRNLMRRIELKGSARCVIKGVRASYLAAFYPGTAQELAFLCGCSVDALPDVLQNWTLERKYIGNSILNRIDPMIWQVSDPWKKLDLRVTIPLSKSAINQLEKAPGALPDMPELHVMDLSPD